MCKLIKKIAITFHESCVEILSKADSKVWVGHGGVPLPLDWGPCRQAVVDLDVVQEEVQGDGDHKHQHVQQE